jgi:hypothetical protein
MDGARAVAIVGGSALEPRLRWIAEPLPVTPDLLALTSPVEPTEVFRFAAPCAEHGCQHYDGDGCRLGAKVAALPVAVDFKPLPPCTLRPSCRWYAEQGRAICHRCTGIVTTDYRAGTRLRHAADPATERPELTPDACRRSETGRSH